MGWISKNLEKTLSFCRFFSFGGLLDGVVQASWELFRAMVVRSWVVLACFGAKLRYVGGKMATKSAEMSQHRLQVEVQEAILAATWASWGR